MRTVTDNLKTAARSLCLIFLTGSLALCDAAPADTRRLNYFPDGGDFACVNGCNYYTRALYGGNSAYRLETSDRPVFAVYVKNDSRNVRFWLALDGLLMPLDAAEHCEARYSPGMRRYTLGDSRWHGGQVSISAAATVESEGAVFKFLLSGFDKPVTIKAKVSPVVSNSFMRGGDIGIDDLRNFDAAPGNAGVDSVEWLAADKGHGEKTTYFAVEGTSVSTMTPAEMEDAYAGVSEYFKQLSGQVVFNTPDDYINTLGWALTAAADGCFDGMTWLHGCVGWRTPFAGWRGAYAADVLGWGDRAVSHFDSYAASQVVGVPPIDCGRPTQDTAMNMARAEKRWGTQMYSDGYICRRPGRRDEMSHYDMNLCYVDELLWHFCYDADTAYMRKMWPVLNAHRAWEKRNFDPDNDGLYDAYCCIWASDALYYSGGGVTHSSAYNYRSNKLMAVMANLIGEDAAPYEEEARRILEAMNGRLWTDDAVTEASQKNPSADFGTGHWAEYVETLGLRRRHDCAALWSIYTPIDCGAATGEQCYEATRYIDSHIPHISVEADGIDYGSTLSTSCWMPYAWSINNVAPAEVMHTALAYFEAGRADEAFNIMRANIIDQMYLGSSPANFGQLSHYDAARGECYRDFGDCIGISARTLLQGLFGIVPDALNGRCVIRPGFPHHWDSASVVTPYIIYSFKRENGKCIYDITQRFSKPLTIVVRQNTGRGTYRDIRGTAGQHQVIVTDEPAYVQDEPAVPVDYSIAGADWGLGEPPVGDYEMVNIDDVLNASVADIFKNKYMSPRPPTTTLQIPVQGVGEWCHPEYCPTIDDSVFRSLVVDDMFTVAGVPFRTRGPSGGDNIAYTSLWDNYPDSVSVELHGSAAAVSLLLAGSTNHMQSRIDNGIVTVAYTDGTTDTLRLRNPDNWCPIEQDYYVDGKAFTTAVRRPYRVCLGTGTVSRDLGEALSITGVYGREIPGGAAQMLVMPLDASKTLRTLTLRTLSTDVVIGLMALSLCR